MDTGAMEYKAVMKENGMEFCMDLCRIVNDGYLKMLCSEWDIEC